MVAHRGRWGLPRRDEAARARLAGAASAAAARVDPTPAPTADPSAAAFFDVDNTLMRGASLYYFARGLAARRFFTTRDLARFGLEQLAFRVGGTETDGRLLRARDAALAFVAGREVAALVGHCEEIYDELVADRIWAGTHALALAHLAAGERVWLVTATPVELAGVIARRLGLTGALGTVAEVEAGRYTGRLVGEPLHGPAKAEAVRALAGRESLDLARCVAYSDSRNDVPMLTLVGRAVAVNPDRELRRTARDRGWEVRDYRTARKAARVGLPALAGAGAIAGGVVGSVAGTRAAARRRLR